MASNTNIAASMEALNTFVDQYPAVVLILIGTFCLLLLILIYFFVLATVAFFRGYKVSFWPPSFDPVTSFKKDDTSIQSKLDEVLEKLRQSKSDETAVIVDTQSRQLEELLNHVKLIALRIDHVERQTVLPTYRIPDISSLNTIDDLPDQLGGQIVLVKLDLDIPFKGEDGSLLSHIKFHRTFETIRSVHRKNGKVALLIGQGIASIDEFEDGDREYLLQQHADALNILSGDHITFRALKKIPNRKDFLSNDDVLILPNLAKISPEDERCLKEQNFNLTKDQVLSSNLVVSLQGFYDIFVLDDFRSTIKMLPSNYGLALNHPSVIGEGVKKDIEGLSSLVSNCIHYGKTTSSMRLCISGSSRPSDIVIIESVLRYKLFDYVAVGPIPSLVLLLAKGIKLHDRIYEKLVILAKKNGFDLSFLVEEVAKKVLIGFGNKIVLPVDYQVDRNGQSITLTSEEFVNQELFVEAIGEATLGRYCELIDNAALVFHFGMLGHTRYPYRAVTEKVIERYAKVNCASYMAGDHIAGLAQSINVHEDINYMIRGAKTTSYYFTNHRLPGLDSFVKK